MPTDGGTLLLLLLKVFKFALFRLSVVGIAEALKSLLSWLTAASMGEGDVGTSNRTYTMVTGCILWL